MLDTFTFGVEFECVLPGGRIALRNALREAGIVAHIEGYNHTTSPAPNDWHLKTDGSIRTEGRGEACEVVSPILCGEDGFDKVRKVTGLLVAHGAKVNTSTGFHVHVGVRQKPVAFFKRLARLYRDHESKIEAALAPSRRGNVNTYCRATRFDDSAMDRASTVRDVANLINGGSRYSKLNFQSYFTHGTVEFRQHQGTVETEKSLNWIKFALRMVAYADRGNEPIRSTIRTEGTKSALIAHMLLAPEGTTRAAICAAMGWPQVNVLDHARWNNIALRKVRHGRTIRYYGTRIEAGSPVAEERTATASNLAGLLAMIGADETEVAYFNRRQEQFSRR